MHYSRWSAIVVSFEFFAAESVGDDKFAPMFQRKIDVPQGFFFVFQMRKHAKTDNSVKRFWGESSIFDVSKFYAEVFEMWMLCFAYFDHVFWVVYCGNWSGCSNRFGQVGNKYARAGAHIQNVLSRL